MYHVFQLLNIINMNYVWYNLAVVMLILYNDSVYNKTVHCLLLRNLALSFFLSHSFSLWRLNCEVKWFPQLSPIQFWCHANHCNSRGASACTHWTHGTHWYMELLPWWRSWIEMPPFSPVSAIYHTPSHFIRILLSLSVFFDNLDPRSDAH